MADRTLQRILSAAAVCFILAACVPVQPDSAQILNTPPAARDWFDQAELEAALIVAGVNPEERAAALCSEDPANPGHYWSCVQYDGRELLHYWWAATWDDADQRVEIRWQNNVELQL